MLGRSATPTAYTRRLETQCPQCAVPLVQDEWGVWCQVCLWCGTCRGRGCAACPQPDADPLVPVGVAEVRRECETCRRSVQWEQWPQCFDCLYHRVKPAEVVPLVGASSQVIRQKRQQWLRNHPGWTLIPASERLLRRGGTREDPSGAILLDVRYVVQRGSSAVL